VPTYRFKTRGTFIFNASELRRKYDITWKGREKESLDLLVVKTTQYSWSLGEIMLLMEMSPEILISLSSETISTCSTEHKVADLHKRSACAGFRCPG